MINKIVFNEPPIDRGEILRYCGAKNSDGKIQKLIDELLCEVEPLLKYSVCYDVFDVDINNDICNFSAFSVESKALAKNLCGCQKAIVFAATIGTEIDRLIAKYGKLSPSKALVLQAIGAQRIEALCDCFCNGIGLKFDRRLNPRFSPGYGDVSLEVQKDIFSVLQCSKHIGLCLNDSLLMSPSKSVTAFVGVTEEKYVAPNKKSKCISCNKSNCEFRR